MRKELKEKIKQDELRSGLEHAWAWTSAHPREVKVGLVAVFVLAAGAIGISYERGRRAQEAERAMSEALQVFHAPVAGEVPEGFESASPSFATAHEKHQKAAAAFDGIERRFGPSSAAGRRARYYGALSRIELGQFAEAQKALEELARAGDGLEPALARMALANLHRRQGEIDQAVDSYRRLVDDASWPLPRDHALMSLASTLEEARRLPEAAASYQRLAEEFPGSVYADEARRRAEYLRARRG